MPKMRPIGERIESLEKTLNLMKQQRRVHNEQMKLKEMRKAHRPTTRRRVPLKR